MPRPRRAGFTLLEVLLALAIAGLFLGGLFGQLATSLTAARAGTGATLALRVAQTTLEDLLVAPLPAGAMDAGPLDEAGERDGHAWAAHLTPLLAHAATPDLPGYVLVQVDVTARPLVGPPVGGVTLTSLRLVGQLPPDG